MMRDKNFSAAMERAVQARGEDWRYPKPGASDDDYYQNFVPTYVSRSGEATCLIGAAMYEAGMNMPSYHCTQSAMALLNHKVSSEVAMAARAAQIHQDQHKPWGEALKVYYAALEYCQERRYAGSAVGIWGAHQVYYEALLRAGLVIPSEITSSPVSQMTTFQEAMTNLSKTIGKITITMDTPPLTPVYFKEEAVVLKTDSGLTITNMSSVTITKKEHALVA